MLRISELFGQFYGAATMNIQRTFPEGRILLPVLERWDLDFSHQPECLTDPQHTNARLAPSGPFTDRLFAS